MLLQNYTKEIFRPECNPQFQSLHCFAHLEQDIREVLPYLNAELGGTAYTQDPPSLMLQVQGQLIALHPRKIAINALKKESDADKILQWLQHEINDVWDRRHTITPSYTVASKPLLIEVLKMLPKTNCKQCGLPTCTVFASLAIQGIKDETDCPDLNSQMKSTLRSYLQQFSFPD